MGLEKSEEAEPQNVFVAVVQKGKTESWELCLMCDFSFLVPSSLPSTSPNSSLALSSHFLLRILPLPPCLYFFTHRKIKTNYFIVSLAFADLLVSVLVMPFGAIELVQDVWIYGEMFCLVRTSLDVLLTTASIFHLCCISLDR